MKINFRNRFVLLTILYMIFILIMTWFYPYSFFSIYKRYSWETYEVYSNGKSYKELLDEFKAIHEADLMAEKDNDSLPNMIIDHTVGLLDFFQQEWLLNDDPTQMDDKELSDMEFNLQIAKRNILDLLVQVDFSIDGKYYLVEMLHHIDEMEKTISELKQAAYFTRNDLRRNFNNLYGEMLFLLDFYRTFYENVKNGEFNIEVS
ncbi:hypothetical protein [Ornithinibacillus scapharcae]|uniref:hypothetical protein n=1 Tax=Ornithinibacillus scapharcae TaxID=1147159 RepID=UPI00110F794B|nr:hypothetical protein [Ornithinibacillus scapharcae]